MTIYTNQPRTHQTNVRRTVTLHGESLTRKREGAGDKFRGTNIETYAFTGVLSAFKLSRGAPVFDEKGTVSTSPYILLTADVPFRLPPNTPPFRVDDEIVDTNGARYVITAPPRWQQGVWEVNVDLRG